MLWMWLWFWKVLNKINISCRLLFLSNGFSINNFIRVFVSLLLFADSGIERRSLKDDKCGEKREERRWEMSTNTRIIFFFFLHISAKKKTNKKRKRLVMYWLLFVLDHWMEDCLHICIKKKDAKMVFFFTSPLQLSFRLNHRHWHRPKAYKDTTQQNNLWCASPQCTYTNSMTCKRFFLSSATSVSFSYEWELDLWVLACEMCWGNLFSYDHHIPYEIEGLKPAVFTAFTINIVKICYESFFFSEDSFSIETLNYLHPIQNEIHAKSYEFLLPVHKIK